MKENNNGRKPKGWGILKPLGATSVVAAVGFSALSSGQSGVVNHVKGFLGKIALPTAEAQTANTKFGRMAAPVTAQDQTGMVTQMKGILNKMTTLMDEATMRPEFYNVTGEEMVIYLRPSAAPATPVMMLERMDRRKMDTGTIRVEMKMMDANEAGVTMDMTVQEVFDKIMKAN